MIQLIGKGINRVSTPKNLFYHNIANTINTADEKVIHKEERIFQGHHVVQAHTYISFVSNKRCINENV